MPLEEILAMINFASQSFALDEHCSLSLQPRLSIVSVRGVCATSAELLIKATHPESRLS